MSGRIETDVDADRLVALPASENARRGDETAIGEAIENLGFWGVLVAQETSGKIIVGNHRYRSGLAHGMTVFNVEWWDVDDRTATRMAIADNRHSDLSRFDLPVLTDQLADLPDEEFAGTGFTRDDLDAMLAELELPEIPDLMPHDDVRFVLGVIEFFVPEREVAAWRGEVEHVAGPRESDQVAELRGRLGL